MTNPTGQGANFPSPNALMPSSAGFVESADNAGAGTSLQTTGSPPSGAVGGDLSGTLPNPTVAKLNGAAVAGYGASGDIAAEASGSTVLAGATGKVADAGHRHAMPTLVATGSATPLVASGAGAAGSAAAASHEDHVHPVGAAAGILAVVNYTGAQTYTLSSTTLADLDAANAVVTFTAPASGNVIVRVAALGNSTVGKAAYLQMREGSTPVGQAATALAGTVVVTLGVTLYASGIAPGSHTWKLGYFIDSGGAGNIYTGSTNPLVIVVEAAP